MPCLHPNTAPTPLAAESCPVSDGGRRCSPPTRAAHPPPRTAFARACNPSRPWSAPFIERSPPAPHTPPAFGPVIVRPSPPPPPRHPTPTTLLPPPVCLVLLLLEHLQHPPTPPPPILPHHLAPIRLPPAPERAALPPFRPKRNHKCSVVHCPRKAPLTTTTTTPATTLPLTTTTRFPQAAARPLLSIG